MKAMGPRWIAKTKIPPNKSKNLKSKKIIVQLPKTK
jgi:hypothetical protein